MSERRVRKIELGALTRVEGEGALRIELAGQSVQSVQLAIYEPPRFFEALLRGRGLEETPDITARICGICPIAYQMTAVHALEKALEVTVSPEIRQLRRLLYCGEWIESHGVHMHLLHIPDFFNCSSSLELARTYPEEVKRGLQLKKTGNRLLEVLGGRAVHPINVAVGGFYRVPSKNELRILLDDLQRGLDEAIAVAEWVSKFAFPDFTQDYLMVALRGPGEYPLNEGRIVSSAGLDIAVEDYETHFTECQVAHSTALQSVHLPSQQTYLVGPLARVNLNRDLLHPVARQLSDRVGIIWPCSNPYQSLIARALEVVHAFAEAIELVRGYQDFSPPRHRYSYRDAEACAATEAPRGLIFHRYRVSAEGKIVEAKIVPPTSQNQAQIEGDLRSLIPDLLDQEEATIAINCEKMIRNHDPCISCATHFLDVEIVRK